MREDKSSEFYFLENEKNQRIEGEGVFQEQRRRMGVRLARRKLRKVEHLAMC